MGVVDRGGPRRWGVVAGLAALLFGGPALLGALPVRVSAPAPAQLLQRALASDSVAHQGLAEVDGRLGLPMLPDGDGSTRALNATTRARTWWASATSWRVDRLSPTGQQTTFATDDGVDVWDYESNDLTFTVGAPKVRLPRLDDL